MVREYPLGVTERGEVTPPALHELDREVMEQVWRRGEATVRDVLEALNAGNGRERAYTTVLTVMATLYRKGLLVRRREGRTDIYAPALSRDEYAQARARAGAGALVAEFGEAALTSFAMEMARLDPKTRQRLERRARRD